MPAGFEDPQYILRILAPLLGVHVMQQVPVIGKFICSPDLAQVAQHIPDQKPAGNAVCFGPILSSLDGRRREVDANLPYRLLVAESGCEAAGVGGLAAGDGGARSRGREANTMSK